MKWHPYLHYPKCNKSLYKTTGDKIRKYRVDYNNNPPNVISLFLLLLVRLGDYIVNLCDFYFYKLIGKQTFFLNLQEFNLHNPTVTSSTTAVRCSPPIWNLSVGIFLVSSWHYGLFLLGQNFRFVFEGLSHGFNCSIPRARFVIYHHTRETLKRLVRVHSSLHISLSLSCSHQSKFFSFRFLEYWSFKFP
jgi:hypothetical protein